MKCYECEDEARGVCQTCGIGLCGEHGQLLGRERPVATQNTLQTEGTVTRWFICGTDAEQLSSI